MMLWDLPSPSSINYFWNFGSTLGLCLIIQILRGLFLSFHYVSFSTERFDSVIKIIREVWAGWIIRFIHINGASIFFLFTYLHLFRGLFFFRRVHKNLWTRGVRILILLMAISFLGYVLPWGQISFWGVAVITNLFSIFPILGRDLVYWIWGGFSVGSPTLVRFYSFHFLFPFILVALVVIHLIFLHENGSRNPLGLKRDTDKISFHPYFTVKDIFFIFIFISFFFFFNFFFPYILGDPVNRVPSMPLVTPVHIQPEWYFLTSYAILRSFSRKTIGVLFLFLSVRIFYLVPLFKIKFSVNFSKFRYIFFCFYIFLFFILTKIGSLPAEDPYILLRKILSFLYFSTFIILCN